MAWSDAARAAALEARRAHSQMKLSPGSRVAERNYRKANKAFLKERARMLRLSKVAVMTQTSMIGTPYVTLKTRTMADAHAEAIKMSYAKMKKSGAWSTKRSK